jgi:Ca-activated chloride channel family protein
MIELFHFLRPWWLAALPVIGIIWWVVRHRDSALGAISGNIAQHLKDALTINGDARGGLRAIDGVALMLVLLALVAAGPSWSKRVSPWFEETAPLIVAIEVSDSMRANDLQPTRLDRARFKILDLIAERTGSRTALVAYSGSAHIVVPPSKDADILKPFLESLDPAIMPVPGNSVAPVLSVAETLLGDQSAGGTLLFVTDGFDAGDIAALAEFSLRPGAPSLVGLVVGTDDGGVALLPDGSPVMSDSGGRLDTAVDASLLRRVASEGNVVVVRASTGNADIRRLLRAIDSNLRLADDPDAEWQDAGWWLLWPALFLGLAWFRRGWTMQWA